MKKLTILLFSILISFNSYGDWTEVSKSINGDTFYIDFDTIKEHKGYVYFWDLTDYLKPDEIGYMSFKLYKQGDCGVNRIKPLSFIFYEQPMGEGDGKTINPPDDEWVYPSPGSISRNILWYVCLYVE